MSKRSRTPASAERVRARSARRAAAPSVFSSASSRRRRAQLARRDERLRVDGHRRRRSDHARRSQASSSAGVAMSSLRPVRDLGVDEVLDEIERRGSGSTPARLERLGGHRRTVPREPRTCNTGYCLTTVLLTPSTEIVRCRRASRRAPGVRRPPMRSTRRSGRTRSRTPTTRGFRPTSFARCACQRRFGSSRSSQTRTRCAAVMKSATNEHPSAGQGNGSVLTQNQPP